MHKTRRRDRNGKRAESRISCFETLEDRRLLAASPEWLLNVAGTSSDAWNLSSSAAALPSGDVYVSFRFTNTVDFDPGPGKFELTSAGDGDLAIARYTADGEFVWARRMGGIGLDIDIRVVTDRAGNAYFAAEYSGAAEIGGVNYTSVESVDGFVTKIDGDGNFIWTRQFALSGDGYSPRAIGGIVVDDRDANSANWSVFVAGHFSGTGQFGTQTLRSASRGVDGYVSRLSAASGEFQWTKAIGSSGNDYPQDLAIATTGSLGLYVATDGVGLTKLDVGTGATQWTRALPPDINNNLAIATNGAHVFIQQTFSGTVDFNPGAGVFNLTSAAQYDIALVNLDSAGNCVWARRLGASGSATTIRGNVAATPDGSVYMTGGFSGTIQAGAQTLTAASGDVFVAKLNAAGDYIEAFAFGDAYGEGIIVDASENVYVGGRVGAHTTTAPVLFPTGDRLVSPGQTSMVLLKFSPTAPPVDPIVRIDTFFAAPQRIVADTSVALNVTRVHDPTERIKTVTFYRDNGDGVLNAADDIAAGSDADLKGGWKANASTSGLASGTYVYFAQAFDIDGVAIAEAAAQVEVLAVETISNVSANVPKAILDQKTISSTLTVPNGFTILDVDVTLNITHPNDADLDVTLIGPDGTRMLLFADVGGAGDNFSGTTLDDEATTSIAVGAAPFAGRFRPQSSLSAFEGKNAGGVWTLQIADDSKKNTGTLNGWSLQFTRSAASAAMTGASLTNAQVMDLALDAKPAVRVSSASSKLLSAAPLPPAVDVAFGHDSDYISRMTVAGVRDSLGKGLTSTREQKAEEEMPDMASLQTTFASIGHQF